MSMEISERELQKREEYTQKAKEAGDILNAVFFIHYFNWCINLFGPSPKPPNISPQEVFGEYDANEYDICLEKSKKLLSRIAYVGAAFHKYQDSYETYDEALYRMRLENPGFNEECYSKAANRSITTMR